jgi:hypothetical protein
MRYFNLVPAVNVGSAVVTILGIAEYDHGRRPAIRLFSLLAEEDGGDGKATEPHGDLSVNIPQQSLPEGTFFGRDYSYHAETFDAMVAAGYVEVVQKEVGDVGGHGLCCVARLTEKATATPATFEE